MLTPFTFLYLLITIILLIKGIKNHNVKYLQILSVSWWLGSIASAFFIAYAWSQGSHSENWSMYGVFFFSLPVLILTAIFAIIVIVSIKRKKIGDLGRLLISSYLLLLFIIAQVLFIGFWAWLHP